MSTRISSWIAAFGLVLIAQPATSLTLDFSEFSHGDIVTSSQGVGVRTINIGGGPDLGVAFDTNLSATADPDLERGDGFSGGNLPADVNLGISIIIQENQQGCGVASCSRPDDEGSRPAGSIELDYSSIGTFDTFSFDLIDVESVTAEAGSVEFFLGGSEVAEVAFNDFLIGSDVVFGDNSANRIVDIVSGTSFDRVVINLGGSGAIDNITAANPVPEPSAALLFGMGALVAGGGVRRAS